MVEYYDYVNSVIFRHYVTHHCDSAHVQGGQDVLIRNKLTLTISDRNEVRPCQQLAGRGLGITI